MGLHITDLHHASAIGETAHHDHTNVAAQILCSKPAAGSFGVLAVAGCSVASGALASSHRSPIGRLGHSLANVPSQMANALLPRTDFRHGKSHAHWPLLHGPHGALPTRSKMGMQQAERGVGFLDVDRTRDTGFLDVDIRGLTSFGSRAAKTSISSQEEDALEEAQQAEAEADHAQYNVRKAITTAMDASENSLSAAEVAIYTEVIAAVGTIAGIATAWIGWKLHDSNVPNDLKVPDVGNTLPPELMRPPPDRRVSRACAPVAPVQVRPSRSNEPTSTTAAPPPTTAAPPATVPDDTGTTAADTTGDVQSY